MKTTKTASNGKALRSILKDQESLEIERHKVFATERVLTAWIESRQRIALAAIESEERLGIANLPKDASGDAAEIVPLIAMLAKHALPLFAAMEAERANTEATSAAHG